MRSRGFGAGAPMIRWWQAVLFVEALQAANKRFEYKWYEKEGHGNVKLENQIDEWQRIESFLYENL